MNKVILMGRLTRDPNVRYTQQNSSQESMCVARYTLAVDRWGQRDGQPSADFISCVAFGRNGEFAEKHLKQGTKIVVTGRIQTGSYLSVSYTHLFDMFVTPVRRSIVAEKSTTAMIPLPKFSKCGIVSQDYRCVVHELLKEMEG